MLVAAAAVIPMMSGLAACGSSTATPPPLKSETSLRVRALAADHERLATPLNAQADRFVDGMNRLGSNTVPPQVAALSNLFSLAIQRFDAGLRRLSFPGSLRSDVATLLRSDEALAGDLRAQTVVASSSFGEWLHTLDVDKTANDDAVRKIHVDLGLPPARIPTAVPRNA